ncbi:MAG: hypothetical protein ACXIT9_05825 [Nitritalea sp.]
MYNLFNCLNKYVFDSKTYFDLSCILLFYKQINIKKYLIFSFIVVWFGCSKKEQNVVPIYQELDLSIQSLTIDTLLLEKDYFSGVGFLMVANERVLFVDQLFSSIFSYDVKGEYLGTYLGKGQGPNNQNVIHGLQPYAFDGFHLILDNFQLVVYDKDFQRVESFPIEWEYSESYQDMLNNPKAEMLGLYEIDTKQHGYNTSFIVSRQSDEILLPMTMSHPKLNGYISEEYYKYVYVLGKYNIKTKKVESGVGKRSEEYLKQLFIPNFDFSFISQGEDKIFISYGIDPLIHVYDFNGTLRYKFGKEGLEMNTAYPKTSTIDDALDRYKSDLKRAGFYHHIYHDTHSDLTFRSYYPNGIEQGFSRLQIYKGNTLIGDVQVPERFQVIGKIRDYYFADGLIDEEND